MATQTVIPPFPERLKHWPGLDLPKVYGLKMYLFFFSLMIAAGYAISCVHLYKPGDAIGYNLGLAGGLMMLSLLLYPLRKRVGFMSNWHPLPKWFRWHVACGVFGPLLIIFHSTFEISSINAGAAFIFTMVVSGSGIFGRFFHTKVHLGLHGSQALHQSLQKELDGYAGAQCRLGFAPGIRQQLAEFRDVATNSSRSGTLDWWNFLSLSMRAHFLSRTLIVELNDAVYAGVNGLSLNATQIVQLDELYYQSKIFIHAYLNVVQDLAQFKTYEKLFSLWHFLHIPPVFLLVFSALWHVFAVHMY